MFDVKKEAAALSAELETIYKDLHRHPEIGYDEHRTSGIIADYLRACGMEVQTGIAITGVVGTLDSGRPGKTLLIRADMDCLQVEEMTACDYRSENPGKMHACGHDAHVTMLLGAAKLLSAHRDAFRGKIKFLFEPSEESIPASMKETVRAAGYDGEGGAGFMIQQGVLEGVDMALALHVQPAVPAGKIQIARHEATASSDVYDIMLTGKGGHGAMPETGVDPINIAAHIYLSLQELIARELAAKTPAVVTVGRFCGGEAPNIIPGACVLEGTIRTFDREVTARLMTRITELAEGIAKAFRGSARTEELASAPPLKNDPALVNRMADWAEELLGKQSVYRLDEGGMGSEDFASYTYEVPSAYLLLGAGTPQEDPRYGKPMHNEAVVFNEDVLPTGAALHTLFALRMLAQET